MGSCIFRVLQADLFSYFDVSSIFDLGLPLVVPFNLKLPETAVCPTQQIPGACGAPTCANSAVSSQQSFAFSIISE